MEPADERTWIALIRGIGPWTHKKMSMAQLRDAMETAGLEDVRTVLATGNALFRSSLGEPQLQALFAEIIGGHDLDLPVFFRTPEDLSDLIARAPWPDARTERPNLVLVTFLNTAIGPASEAELAMWPGPERIAVSGREVFVDYQDGVGRSKLTFDELAKRTGQPGTSRNWNTVVKLTDRAAGG